MPSIGYYNQTGPFWDWVASLEDQGANHPFFNRRQQNEEGGEEGEFAGRWGPWAGHHRGFPFRGPPPPHPPPPPHHGTEGHPPPPPPPPPAEGEHPPPPPPGEDGEPSHSPPFPGHDRREHHREHHRGRHGGCPGRRGGRGFGGRGGWHGRGGGPFGFGGPGMPWGLAPFMQNLFNAGNNDETGEAAQDETDFAPDADVFDTEASFVVHVSLPGAKKEDVGVNWDAEKSELSIAGVIYRPGDENFLQTLAMNERKVGPFERKIRLGSRANPAQVDSDMITAKLEDGVLRIDVPKLDKDYVEVKKVDVL